jgi:capsular polysaccharide biosynthesis protein
VEPERFLSILRRAALPIIVVGVLVGGAVGIVASVLPKSYEASTTLIVGGTVLGEPPTIDGLEAGSRLATTLSQLAVSRPVLAAALQAVGDGSDPDDFREQVDARSAPDSLLVLITVHADDAARTAALADAVGAALVDQAPALLGTAADPTATKVTTIEPAVVPDAAESPRVLLTAVLAGIAAAFVLLVLVLIVEARQDGATAWGRTSTTGSSAGGPGSATETRPGSGPTVADRRT